MSETRSDPRLSGRTAPKRRVRLAWSDPRLRNIVWQVLVVGLVAALLWFLIGNTNRNLAARHIATGFAFLGRTAGIPIGEHLIAYDPSIDTYGDAIVIGILNTLRVSVVGIVLASILGTLVGIGRLSRNWLVAKVSAVYVETLRDLPVLLQLMFWYGLLQGLPAPRQAWHIGGVVFLSNRGIKFPLLDWETAHWCALIALAIGLIGTLSWRRSARLRQEETGLRPPVWPMALALMFVLPLGVWVVLGSPFTLEYPVLRGFNFQGGGTASPEFGALLVGLVTYTSGYIAEIVRSGIQAVPNGQTEAAAALGLRPRSVLRLVVLPQALRVIIPPMTSQYLNLTKNSSLAVAVGYQDVVSLANTTLNQTGQAIEGIALIMAVYLTISLSISLFMNWYNAHIALVER